MKYCANCMQELDESGICSHCTYDNSTENPNFALPTGYILKDTYYIGRVIFKNSLLITYMAKNKETDDVLFIEECFPVEFAKRMPDGGVHYYEANRVPYKTMVSDISDKWTQLSRFTDPAKLNTIDIFNANETVYCVYSARQGITLSKFLKKTGPIDWVTAKEIFMPLLSLIAKLHRKGFIHGGISTSNILIDKKGKTTLVGFALPELRTKGSIITPQLYDGYSAPEQYSRSQWQGQWTDVYSIAAVMFKALTGEKPLDAETRLSHDRQKPASHYSKAIPDNINAALKKALSVDTSSRYKTVDEFSAALLSEAGDNTAVFSPNAVIEKTDNESKLKKFIANPHFYERLFLLGLIISVILNINLFWQNTRLKNPEVNPQLPAETENIMEYNFVGLYIKNARDTIETIDNIEINFEYTYNEEYPENVVYKQSTPKGMVLPESKKVTVYVSRGSRYITVPYLVGSSLNFAGKTLTDSGIKYTIIYDYNPESTGQYDTVIAIDKGFGQKISKTEDTVTLTVKADPDKVYE